MNMQDPTRNLAGAPDHRDAGICGIYRVVACLDPLRRVTGWFDDDDILAHRSAS